MWILESIVESVLITVFCFFIVGDLSINERGYSTDLWLVGMTM